MKLKSNALEMRSVLIILSRGEWNFFFSLLCNHNEHSMKKYS